MQQTRRASFPMLSTAGLVAGILLVAIAEFLMNDLADGNETWHWIQHGVFFLGGLVAGVAAARVHLSERG